MKKWFKQMPIYVTRPYGPDEYRGSIWLSFWMVLLLNILVFGNLVGWGIYGISQLIEKII